MSKIISTFRLFLFLTLSSVFTACKDTNSRQTEDHSAIDTSAISVPKIEQIKEKTTLYAWVDQLRVREEADKKAKIVAEIKEGGVLKFLEEQSDFTEKINLRGILYDEPWLKVETAAGKIGWVYGGGVKFYAPKVDAAPSPYDDCYALFADNKWEKGNTCLEKIHQQQLKKENRWVKETKESLNILLLDGSTKKFVNQELGSIEDEYTNYEYRYYLPKMGFHLLKLYGYEWSAFLLVNDKSGKTTEVNGYPKASPDFKHLIATNVDLEAQFEFNGIQLFGFTDNGFEMVFSKELDDYGPVTPIWLDAKTVEMVFQPSRENPEQKDKRVSLLQDEAGNWNLED